MKTFHPYFEDRRDAGQALAEQLMAYANQPDIIVLGLPRGGVPVAFEVAQALHAPLDVFLVRKLGMPGHEELAIGAIASGGMRVLNDDVIDVWYISAETIAAVTLRERIELERREKLFRGDRPPLNVRDCTVILVDDGLATGATMLAAVRTLKQQEPIRLLAAVPIAAPETCEAFEQEVDEIICAVTPEPFFSVGLWYADFPQVPDAEVQYLIEQGVSIHE